MTKKIKILTILLAFCILAIAIGQVSANTYTIEENTENFTELDNKIQMNDVVDLDKDYTAVNGEKEIVINKNITINGNYHYIDANHQCKIFHINKNGSLILNNVHLINGYSEDCGGAIDNGDGGSLTITGSSFGNNIAKIDGGAIFNTGTLIINNSQFHDNEAFDDGGVISNYGTLIINNSDFSYNKAWGFGGAINNFDTLIINNSYFGNNIAEFYGGAIRNFGALTVTNSSFCYNEAFDDGGAIYNEGNLNKFNCTFYHNEPNDYNNYWIKCSADSFISNNGIVKNTANSLKKNNNMVKNSISSTIFKTSNFVEENAKEIVNDFVNEIKNNRFKLMKIFLHTFLFLIPF